MVIMDIDSEVRFPEVECVGTVYNLSTWEARKHYKIPLQNQPLGGGF